MRIFFLLLTLLMAASNVHFANYGIATLNTLAFFLILLDWK